MIDLRHYILDDQGEPKPVDLMTWAHWFENPENRTVARYELGDVMVSTVFLGLDHGFPPGVGDPVLWETMIFGGPEDGYQERYTSKEAALEGHSQAVALVNNACLH